MKIEYVYKLDNEKKDFTVFEDAEIPETIKNIINENEAFSVSRVFGEKGLGSPEEIEILNITFADGKKREFKYINKGIHYMFMGGEKDRPVFQVFTHFMIAVRK